MRPQRLITKVADTMPPGILLEYELAQEDDDTDGRVTLTTAGGGRKNFTLEIKTVHRIETLAGIERRTNQSVNGLPVLLICNRLSPPLADYCMQNRINFIDSAGNAHIDVPGLCIIIQGKQEEKTNVAVGGIFPEGVMKLLFVLLSEPDALNKTYRQLAELSGISLGMVSKAFDILEQRRHYRKAKTGRRLIDTDGLSAMWINDYARSLKPRLDLLTLEAPSSWENLPLETGEYASGELAAASLSGGYLAPVTGIIYTPYSLVERRNRLALRPALEPGLQIIASFWGSLTLNSRAKAMLCLGDLLDGGDDRSREVARIINDKYLNLKDSALFSY